GEFREEPPPSPRGTPPQRRGSLRHPLPLPPRTLRPGPARLLQLLRRPPPRRGTPPAGSPEVDGGHGRPPPHRSGRQRARAGELRGETPQPEDRHPSGGRRRGGGRAPPSDHGYHVR